MYEESIQQESLVEAKTAVTVYVDQGEMVSVTPKSKKVNKPNYFMVGNGTMNKHRIYGIDLLREIANSTKAEQFLILAIKDGISYDNNFSHVVKVVGGNKHQQNQISEGFKKLEERNLVKRTKRSHYMINPNALITPNYEEALADWEQH